MEQVRDCFTIMEQAGAGEHIAAGGPERIFEHGDGLPSGQIGCAWLGCVVVRGEHGFQTTGIGAFTAPHAQATTPRLGYT